MPALSFSTDADERVLAGVCAGIAQALGVDVTLVRVVFALLALAGGAAIVLYLALWMWSRSDRAWWAVVLLLFAGALVLGALLHWRGARSASCAGGCTRISPSETTRRRCSPRSLRSPPTSRSSTASASRSRAQATRRSTTRSSLPRARRWRMRRSSRASR